MKERRDVMPTAHCTITVVLLSSPNPSVHNTALLIADSANLIKLKSTKLDFISIFSFSILFLLYPMQISGLICVNYHKYYEDGKLRIINRGVCGASNGFCVTVQFWDKDPIRKRGISLGRDKIDCEHFGEPGYGWTTDGCRKDRFLGSDGEICCCQQDLCNSYSAALPWSMGSLCYIFVFFSFNYFLLTWNNISRPLSFASFTRVCSPALKAAHIYWTLAPLNVSATFLKYEIHKH